MLSCEDSNGFFAGESIMRLVRYARDGVTSCGVLLEGGIADVQAMWRGPRVPRDLAEVLAAGPGMLTELAQRAAEVPLVDTAGVRILAPIQRPGKLLALAGNYARHIVEAGLKLGLSESPASTTVPRLFLKPATTVIGDGEEIPWPTYSRDVDYELELGVVIGRTARRVGVGEALDYVGGYTIVNDVSARTVTVKEGRAQRPWDEFYDWLLGKWSDGFCPMGPWLVTADEVKDVQNLQMELKVNGTPRQQANTSQMIHSVAFIVSFASHVCTLEPGDVIATGTPHGVGLATGNYLNEGDLIECRIEGLGVLRNTLGKRPESFYEPLRRR
jgi:2-keto-4-pentenoate hydratase/2-oxohepta-3-ene-1,7-dioic acid hydratase in catechol pathway